MHLFWRRVLSSGHDRQTAPNTSVHHRNSTEHTNSLSNWKIKTSCELEKRNFRYIFALGKMAEWSIAAVLKTVELRGSGGSNPSLSARKHRTIDRLQIYIRFYIHKVKADVLFHRPSHVRIGNIACHRHYLPHKLYLPATPVLHNQLGAHKSRQTHLRQPYFSHLCKVSRPKPCV